MKNIGLEELREVFVDDRTHIAVGRIKQIVTASDRSFQKVLVQVFDAVEPREIVARMTWDGVGVESGIFHPVSVDDLVLVAFADGSDDYPFVIRRLTTKEDRIPLRASEGHSVFRSMSGKKAWITSNTRINISKGDSEPTEPLVLGAVAKILLSEILAELKTLSETLASHTHVTGAPGGPTSAPLQSSNITSSGTKFDNLKGNPVDNGAIISDIAFTEKG